MFWRCGNRSHRSSCTACRGNLNCSSWRLLAYTDKQHTHPNTQTCIQTHTHKYTDTYIHDTWQTSYNQQTNEIWHSSCRNDKNGNTISPSKVEVNTLRNLNPGLWLVLLCFDDKTFLPFVDKVGRSVWCPEGGQKAGEDFWNPKDDVEEACMSMDGQIF